MRLRSAPVHHPQLAAALKQRPSSCLPLTSKLVLATSQQRIAKLSVGGRSTTPASSPGITRSICPATASPRAGGMASAPAAWAAGEASVTRFGHVRGLRSHNRRAARPSSWPRNAVPAFDVVLRPTRASPSSTASATQPGRAVLAAHHAGLAEAVAYLGPPGGPAWPWRCPACVRPGAAQPGGQGLAAGAAGERRPTARAAGATGVGGPARPGVPGSRANIDCDDPGRGGRGQV